MKVYTAKASGKLYLSKTGYLAESDKDICEELASAAGLDGYFNGKVTIILEVNDSSTLEITEEEA